MNISRSSETEKYASINRLCILAYLFVKEAIMKSSSNYLNKLRPIIFIFLIVNAALDFYLYYLNISKIFFIIFCFYSIYWAFSIRTKNSFHPIYIISSIGILLVNIFPILNFWFHLNLYYFISVTICFFLIVLAFFFVMFKFFKHDFLFSRKISEFFVTKN